MLRLPAIALLLCAGCGGPPPTDDPCAAPTTPADDAPPPAPHTPRWAFEPWISKDISDTDDTRAFVDGFAQRDIPVGAVVLDSPWETNYNTFAPNPVRYHDFAALVDELHGRGIKLVLWTTQMINSSSFDLEPGGDSYDGPSPDFDHAQACKLLVADGDTYLWWKGTGAGLDFFSPNARAWWHRLQDHVLDLGIDGWKLDFGESYISADPVPTAAGPVDHQTYSEAYYRDFLAYGVARRGPDFTTMVRGWDVSYGFAGRFFARPEHAPVVWAGDNRRDFIGLADALETMFTSARAGYVVVGSDIGGYLDVDDKTFAAVPFSEAVFDRWTAVGALSPFMQLHGRANLTPWGVSEATAVRYRDWAQLHHALVPFFYSLSEEAWAGGAPLLRPIGGAGDYRYTLGDALLVAPILDDSGVRDVTLPAGAAWYDWWNPAADAIAGGQTLAGYDATDLGRIPLFVRQGAIVPTTTALWIWPGPPSSFVLHDEDGGTTRIDAAAGPDAFTVGLSRVATAMKLRVRADRAVTAVSVDGTPTPFTTDGRQVYVDLGVAPTQRSVVLQAPGG